MKAKRITCEHGKLEGPRCRKSATVAIGYLVPFGNRVSMDGPDTTIYREKVTFRCSNHDQVKREQGRMTIEAYQTATAVA